MARTFNEKFGGTWKTLYAPALVEDEVTYNALIASRDIAPIISLWDEIDIALVGIGNIDPGEDVQMLFADYMTHPVNERLKAANAVGDICMRFFDAYGNTISEGLSYVISIGLDRLKRIRTPDRRGWWSRQSRRHRRRGAGRFHQHPDYG